MKFDPKLLFWLQLIATIGTGIGTGVVHLTDVVPPELIKPVTGIIGFVTFCIMSFLTLATGAVGVGAGPLAPKPTVDEARKVMADAQKP